MQRKQYNIKGGLYLVVDPSIPLDNLITKIESALKGGVDVLQIWNHWLNESDKLTIIKSIVALGHQFDTPVIINENIELFAITELDGIHFDNIPKNFEEIKLQRNAIIGLTCGNDFDKIQWAIDHELDYISFCSVFPSSSVNTCDLVDKAIIHKTRESTKMPIFLSGGISLTNMNDLKDTRMDGIAIVSGIMSANDPEEKARQYKQALKNQIV